MNLPTLRYRKKATTFIQEFLGYNHNLRTEPGEFYDMKNISMDHYPVISTRHGVVEKYEYSGKPNGLHEYEENKLMAVIDSSLYAGITADSKGTVVSDSASMLSDSEKEFATIGTKTLIMPDKVIYDAKTNNLDTIEKAVWDKGYEGYDLMLRWIPCAIDGTTALDRGNTIVETNDDPPENPTDGMWWYSVDAGKWYEYSSDGNKWIAITLAYSRLIPVLSDSQMMYVEEEDPSDEALEDLDNVRAFFEMFESFDTFNARINNADSYEYEEFRDYTAIALVDCYPGSGGSHNKDLVINGPAETNLALFHMKRKCPDLEHIVAHNNRIWGVNQEDHELFACKLGDPTQWYRYSSGTAMDSYAVSLGNAAKVTASAVFNSYVHFFTEDKIIKVYGDYPSNYQLHATQTDGVISGGHDTVVQVEGVLFWVSPIGVVAYDGSLPYFRGQKMSPHFLDGKTVVAGKDGYKYCLSVSENGESFGEFIFDTHTGLWMIGGDCIYIKTAELENSLCFINDSSRLVVTYDKSLESDTVIKVSPELFSLDREAAEFQDQFDTLDETKYYIGMTETGGKADGFYGNVADGEVTAFIGLLADDNKAGVGFPVRVEGGAEYKLSYDVAWVGEEMTEDVEKYKYVYISYYDEEYNYLGSYDITKKVKSGSYITAEEDAEWVVLIFGSSAPVYPMAFSNISFTKRFTDDKEIEWELETGNLGLDTPNQKYISRIQLRIDFVGRLQIEISYNDNDYAVVHVSQSDHMKSITVPVNVRRNDHFKIRMSGEGQMRLYSMGYMIAEGSERSSIL